MFCLEVDTEEEVLLIVWLGSDYNVHEHFPDKLQLFDFIKKEFVANVNSHVTSARLYTAGEEPEEFWDYFING